MWIGIPFDPKCYVIFFFQKSFFLKVGSHCPRCCARWEESYQYECPQDAPPRQSLFLDILRQKGVGFLEQKGRVLAFISSILAMYFDTFTQNRRG